MGPAMLHHVGTQRLETDRLILRRYDVADADDMFRNWVTDPEVSRFWGWTPLSPYHYKGGSFHGIHYGSYFNDTCALFAMMDKETAFILKSPQRKRIMIDLYETALTKEVVDRLMTHLKDIAPRVHKLGFSAGKRDMKLLRKAFEKNRIFEDGQLCFGEDMEEVKTWLVR